MKVGKDTEDGEAEIRGMANGRKQLEREATWGMDTGNVGQA